MELRLQLGVLPFFALPLGPVLAQAVRERLRLLRAQTLTERERLVLQLFAAPVDEIRDPSRSSSAQHGQVVLIAKIVSEPMKVVGQLAYRTWRERSQQLQLMPQVLGLLAPLVQIFGRTILAAAAQRVARPPIGGAQTIFDAVPAGIIQLPGADVFDVFF